MEPPTAAKYRWHQRWKRKLIEAWAKSPLSGKVTGSGQVTRKNPYQERFYGHAEHDKTRTLPVKYAQLSGADPFWNLISAPVGYIICNNLECQADSGISVEEQVRRGTTPSKFIPIDPAKPYTLPPDHHFLAANWVQTVDVTSEIWPADPKEENIIYWVKLPPYVDIITDDNQDEVFQYCNRMGVDSSKHTEDDFETYRYYTEGEDDEDVNKRYQEEQFDQAWGGANTEKQSLWPTITVEDHYESAGDSDKEPNPYLELKTPRKSPATPQRTQEEAIFVIPNLSTVPPERSFQDYWERLVYQARIGLMEAQQRSLIKEKEIVAVLATQEKRRIYFYNRDQANEVIQGINEIEDLRTPLRSSEHWSFAQYVASELLQFSQQALNITLRNSVMHNISRYLMSHDGATTSIQRLHILKDPRSNYHRQNHQTENENPFRTQYVKKKQQKKHRYKQEQHQDRNSSSESGDSRRPNRRGRFRTQYSSDDGDMTQLLKDIQQEMGKGEEDLLSGRRSDKNRIDKAKDDLHKLRTLGVEITPTTESRVVLGLAMGWIPSYEPESAQDVEEKLNEPQLFRDEATHWIQTFLDVHKIQEVHGRNMTTQKPKYINKADMYQMRQFKMLVESAPTYNYSLPESNIAIIIEKHQMITRWMMNSAIGFQLIDSVMEQAYSKKGEIKLLVKKEAAIRPLYTEIQLGMITYWQRTIARNLPVVNNLEETQKVIKAHVFAAFLAWEPEKGIRIAKEGAKKCKYQDPTIQCMTSEGKNTTVELKFVEQMFTRSFYQEGATAHGIWTEAAKTHGAHANYTLQNSSIGQLTDFLSIPLDQMEISLKLTSKLLLDQTSKLNLKPSLKTGLVATGPAQSTAKSQNASESGPICSRENSANRARESKPERSTDRPREQERENRTRNSQEYSREKSPYQRQTRSPYRRPTYNRTPSRSPSRYGRSGRYGRTPERRDGRFRSPGTRDRGSKSPERRRRRSSSGNRRSGSPDYRRGRSMSPRSCSHCETWSYDCVPAADHCKNRKHDPPPNNRGKSYARKRSNCPHCLEDRRRRTGATASPSRTSSALEKKNEIWKHRSDVSF